MTDDLDFGPRISGEEYDRRIVALHSALPPAPSREQEENVRRAELDLAIDHRLGRDFPANRRAALWDVQQRLNRKRLGLMAKYLTRRLFGGSLDSDAKELGGYVVNEYATVLTKRELEQYFGKEEVRNPMLPVDQNKNR